MQLCHRTGRARRQRQGPGRLVPPPPGHRLLRPPQHTPADHTLDIDFLNPDLGPSTRVAVELSEDSARALAAAIHTALAAAPALDRPAATAPAAKDP